MITNVTRRGLQEEEGSSRIIEKVDTIKSQIYCTFSIRIMGTHYTHIGIFSLFTIFFKVITGGSMANVAYHHGILRADLFEKI